MNAVHLPTANGSESKLASAAVLCLLRCVSTEVSSAYTTWTFGSAHLFYLVLIPPSVSSSLVSGVKYARLHGRQGPEPVPGLKPGWQEIEEQSEQQWSL